MYQIELTAERQAGFDDQAAKSGLSVQENIQRIIDGYGDGYAVNMTKDQVEAMTAVIKESPDDYAPVIEAKRIEIEAAKVIEAPIEEVP